MTLAGAVGLSLILFVWLLALVGIGLLASACPFVGRFGGMRQGLEGMVVAATVGVVVTLSFACVLAPFT